MEEPISILIPSVDLPGTRGILYMLRHNPDGLPVRVVGTDWNGETMARFGVDCFHKTPSINDPGYFEALAQICKEEKVDLVIPQTEQDALTLSRKRDGLGQAKVLISDRAVVERACDKGALLSLCKEIGLPTPDHALVDTPADLRAVAEGLGYPERDLVVKPAALWGARGFRILTARAPDPMTFFSERASGVEISLEELERVMTQLESHPQLLIMEYLPGSEYSVDAFLGEEGCAAVPRVRDRILAGTAIQSTVEDRKDIAEMTLKIAKHLGLRYTFGFQFKLNAEGVPMILECNPRVQGTCIASLFSGINVVWMGVQEALGLPLQSVPATLQSSTFSRHWGGVASGINWHSEV